MSYISIRIVGSNQARTDEGEGVITGTGFNYVLVDGKVILSSNELRIHTPLRVLCYIRYTANADILWARKLIPRKL